jgi:hypothetical protein
MQNHAARTFENFTGRELAASRTAIPGELLHGRKGGFRFEVQVIVTDQPTHALALRTPIGAFLRGIRTDRN